jgi:hypothetical protein
VAICKFLTKDLLNVKPLMFNKQIAAARQSQPIAQGFAMTGYEMLRK